MRILHRGDLPVHVNTHPVLHFCLHEAEFSWPFLSSGSRHVPFNVVAHQLLWTCAVIHRKRIGFTEVLIRSDNEPAILATKESAATASRLAGVNVKTEERAHCTIRKATDWKRAL